MARKTNKEIKERISNIEINIKKTKDFLGSGEFISYDDEEALEYDISELTTRKKMLEWVLNEKPKAVLIPLKTEI